MEVVPDTNFMLSGLIWDGIPRQGIILAELRRIRLCGTDATYKEFCRVVSYPKFAKKLKALYFSPQRLALDYLNLVSIFSNNFRLNKPIVQDDPDDDIFVYAALAARASIIVSGDRHLLQMRQVMGVHVLNPAELIRLAELLERKRESSRNRFPRHPRLLKFRRRKQS